jgi:thiazole synthase
LVQVQPGELEAKNSCCVKLIYLLLLNQKKMNLPVLEIGNKQFNSRLILGTGKYPSLDTALDSIEVSQTEMVTVAIRRLQKDIHSTQEKNLIQSLDWEKLWLLPNTAGSKTAEDAIRMALLGREFAKQIGQEDNNFIKLEVIPDPKYLLPDPIGTLKAADYLVRAGFTVLPYINADPVLASHLEDLGCATLMPLGSPIGSGQGLKNSYNISLIIDNAKIPVIVDAGIRTPSQAAEVMEMGASAVLLNTAVAKSLDPVNMAYAMAKGVEGGHLAHYAGSMSTAQYAKPSSPSTGLFL